MVIPIKGSLPAKFDKFLKCSQLSMLQIIKLDKSKQGLLFFDFVDPLDKKSIIISSSLWIKQVF